MQNNFNAPRFIPPGEERAYEELRKFRVYLKKFADKEKDPDLQSLNFNEVSEEDMVLFQRFRMGTFHLEDVARQEQLLANLNEGETARKILTYMRKKLAKKIDSAA